MTSMARVHSVLVAMLLTGSFGCGETSAGGDAPGKSSPDDRPVAYTGTMVTTSDGTKFVGDKIAIDVRKGPVGVQVDLNVLVFGQTESWTALVRLPTEHVPTGTGSAEIQQVPLQPGIAYVERHKHDQATKGENGTIAYELDGKHARMRVDSTNSAISAVLDATYVFRCWVMPSELGVAGTGQGSQGAVELVLDESFKSGFCSQLRR